MEASDIRNLQEAYLEVYSSPEEIDEGAAGDVASRAAKLSRQLKGQTPERKKLYKSLASNAKARASGENPGDEFRGRKVSSRPMHWGRAGLTQSERDDRRDEATPWIWMNPNYPGGSGGITKNPKKLRKQKAMGEFGEQVDLYDIILSYLLDEGYTNSIEGAEVILENMSEGWMESIMEAFVDPETGEAPSGRSPLENVSYHPKKSVRKKAMRAFAKQMSKEYGGKYKAKTEDPTKED